MKKSFIISYKESTEDRRNNLKHVLNYLSVLLDKDTEIIIVEQDSTSKINWLSEIKNNENIKHIFVKNDNIFNKGWGYNIGANQSNGDYLIFHDSDMFLKINTYILSVDFLNKFDVVNPYSNIYYLNKKQTDEFVKSYTLNIFDKNKYEKKVISGVISGGIFFIKKNVFLDLKGFDEECYGYGHEDDIFDTKIRKLNINIKYTNFDAIHIYHENNGVNYYTKLENNKKLFEKYKRMSYQEIKEKINKIDKIGEIKISN